jgi:hypothetical protein
MTDAEVLEKIATECTTGCDDSTHLFHIRHWLPGNPATPAEVRRALRMDRLDHRIATAIQENFRRNPNALRPTPPVPAPEPPPPGVSL